MNKTTKEAIKDSLPIMAGYIALGAGFGVLASTHGVGFIYALLMSIFIYAGSMQYLTVSLLASTTSVISAIFMTIVVNIRHMVYGVAMLEKYSAIKKNKNYTIFSLTDETFSVVVSKEFSEDINKDEYYFKLSLLNQFYWIVGTIIGSLLGNVIPFDTTGIDFSMTALFICVVINQWEQTSDHLPAIGGLIISIICLLIFGSSNFLFPSIIVISIYLLILRGLRHE
ncbi:MAG: AzlC family ABC transporter permease [Erysipelotrichaceae bacterium]|nr:AzlC family ABC transporter permease [Erysipelotrichaceae bacterium]